MPYTAFSWHTTPKPIVALAPMAGVTDASYRQIIKKIAPPCIVYTEFLSTDALAFGAKKTLEMLAFDPAIERPFIVQVFGHDPEHFLEAAKVIEQLGADGIDINMGCPAAKVVSSCHGAALIRKPELAAELVHATLKAVSIPVSVKTRLGWDTHETLIPFCKALEAAGAQMFAIHGRTYNQKFTGRANWEPIYELKKEVSVPVIGNGDIASAADAVEKIKNLDGVMVGRGTFGNPWVMADICDVLRTHSFSRLLVDSQRKNEETKKRINESTPRTFQDKIPFILEHCELAVKIKGEKRGMIEMRRHFSSYVKGFDGASEMRQKLVRVERLDDAKAILTA
ncbi:MAG TPA: tRNA-dihydrouridine synthase family protein [Candidatus Peribacteraceae bacterium]|nr:tRNA-dihydrouridine synthase family protein [Candidatus Peribacteraceae bacterium]